ncbi:hypothetical protein EST38_g4583 [Candolleomyces aberdarensis]|uniref:Putative gamma-glutamylcyclotransferase n=1 Tax=Candolleomyces aberdarensis TaxID=2316362 RepID=A0A4V1Q491_9AGAR|nr:hypothetical protein EST38_g4583 [Candolleomyces aberdarensis]
MAAPDNLGASEGKPAFFYGTLMHPRILRQVIVNDGSHLQFCPAVLLGYTRHKVKDRSYPGIIPSAESTRLFNKGLGPDEDVVRGTLVVGLTESDLEALDDFEDTGDETEEYARITVSVRPLAPLLSLSNHTEEEDALILLHAAPLPPREELLPGIQVDTYVYCNTNDLEPDSWSFPDFVRNHAKLWFDYVAEKA